MGVTRAKHTKKVRSGSPSISKRSGSSFGALGKVAFDEPATVVFVSAEGVTLFEGVDGDPDESATRRWIQAELARPIE